MTLRPLALIGAILATTSAVAAAADTSLNDLRLVGSQTVTDDYALQAGPTVDIRIDDESIWSVALQGVRSLGQQTSFGGLFYGGELFYSRGTGHVDSFGSRLDLATTTWGLTGMLGWAYVMPTLPGLHGELGGYGRIGKTDTTLYAYGSSPAGLKGSDSMDEYGLRAASYWTFSEHHQVGIELRYAIYSETATTIQTGSSSARLEINGSGLSIGIGAGYRY
jgi:hypothetical protein